MDSNNDGDFTNDPDTVGAIASRIVETAGEYTITLSVKDNEGGIGTDQMILTVVTTQQAVGDIVTYLSEMETADFDKSVNQRTLTKQVIDLMKQIESLNPTASLARLDNIKNRAEKWITDAADLDIIVSMIDELMAYLENADGKGKSKQSGKLSAADDIASYSLPKVASLSQNHPNPFNPSTNIQYEVPENSTDRVKLNVYNIRGKLIKTLG